MTNDLYNKIIQKEMEDSGDIYNGWKEDFKKSRSDKNKYNNIQEDTIPQDKDKEPILTGIYTPDPEIYAKFLKNPEIYAKFLKKRKSDEYKKVTVVTDNNGKYTYKEVFIKEEPKTLKEIKIEEKAQRDQKAKVLRQERKIKAMNKKLGELIRSEEEGYST